MNKSSLLRFASPSSITGACMVLILSGCAVGPDYSRPTLPLASSFKEAGTSKQSAMNEQQVSGKWWEAFGDKTLDALEESAQLGSLTLAQAEARYRQALATLKSSQAGQWPSLSVSVGATRGASAGGRNGLTSSGANAPGDQRAVTLSAAWETDLWGKVRRAVESNQANLQASQADLDAARLSLQAQLAQTYFQLRAADGQFKLLSETVEEYQRSLTLTRNQYQVGVVPQENVVQAETQLRTTEAQRLDVQVGRATLEHTLAVLQGKSPSEFSLASGDLNENLVPVLPSLPANLLERRPDVAAAEQRVVAANAQIGVAESAWFPDLTLNASGGYQSNSFSHLFSLPNRVWSVGPGLAEAIFDGGARQAQTDAARASYDLSVATYRATVLSAFQDVEDNLATLRILEQEAQVQQDAVKLAKRSVELTLNQYKAGVVNYLNVVSAQTTLLTNQRTALDIQNRRLQANVGLIKALGGGWRASAASHGAGAASPGPGQTAAR